MFLIYTAKRLKIRKQNQLLSSVSAMTMYSLVASIGWRTLFMFRRYDRLIWWKSFSFTSSHKLNSLGLFDINRLMCGQKWRTSPLAQERELQQLEPNELYQIHSFDICHKWQTIVMGKFCKSSSFSTSLYFTFSFSTHWKSFELVSIF